MQERNRKREKKTLTSFGFGTYHRGRPIPAAEDVFEIAKESKRDGVGTERGGTLARRTRCVAPEEPVQAKSLSQCWYQMIQGCVSLSR